MKKIFFRDWECHKKGDSTSEAGQMALPPQAPIWIRVGLIKKHSGLLCVAKEIVTIVVTVMLYVSTR